MKKVETVEVMDHRHHTLRAVTVTVETPNVEGLDLTALAQKAYDRDGKKWSDGTVTVRVALFGGRALRP